MRAIDGQCRHHATYPHITLTSAALTRTDAQTDNGNMLQDIMDLDQEPTVTIQVSAITYYLTLLVPYLPFGIIDLGAYLHQRR